MKNRFSFTKVDRHKPDEIPLFQGISGRNRDEYVVKTIDGDIKLRSSLADCGNVSVQKEVEDIKYNIPELFVD